MRSPLRLLAVLLSFSLPLSLSAQSQPVDEEYTKKIKEFLRDPRITTELVDHLPASTTVPSPLAFHGRIVGTPGELTYAKDIHRYFRALDDASDRVLTWTIGETEEGREMIVLAVADEATILDLERYKGMLNSLGDPRKTPDDEARKLISQAKPMYWLTSGIHSPENGGPEMLMELAYRLAVQETPFIRTIRDNVITLITPVIEVDGREKQVDTYYFNKQRPAGTQRLPLMYWGKYVAHDNNRDAMGQFLALTRNVNRFWLDWTPTVMHDLHESATYLYSSTGTGPYNEALDPITVSEWWTLAQTDVMELTRRGVPGVWTYGFYDGWVPNYMFYVAHARNGTGRFYEAQSYGPDNYVVRPPATTTSREWFRPNPPLDSINWGPRNNTNIQQSGVLFSLHQVAKNRETWVENWWLKNKRSVEKGRNGPVFGWVIPAGQRRKSDAAVAVNDLRRQGLEFHVAEADFTAGRVSVKAGDWIVRADQPYRTLADMYFAVQNYPVTNPRPYDDTGWTFQYLRNVVLHPVTDRGLLTARMAPLTDDARAAGGITGTGAVVVVDHTADNNLVALRYRFAAVKMMAAEADFEVAGRKFRAGAFIISDADRARLDPVLKELGLTGVALVKAPEVKTHELDLPRIGYVHAWGNTQNEGWVRAALDTYGIPYAYFADQKLREGNLRAKYDVIIFPHVGGSAQAHVNGIPKIDTIPLPYRKTDAAPNLGALDHSDDIRGGMGLEGLAALRQFVEDGGTLITEGSAATIFPEYALTSGVTVERPANLFVRGSIVRGVVADRSHPIAYGFDAQVPVYFNQDPVLAVGGGGFGGFGGPAAAGSQNITPMATPLRISPWVQEGDSAAAPAAPRPAPAAGQGGGGFGQPGPTGPPPRAVLRFPASAGDILLSGTLAGGEAITNRAQIVDAPLGKGHVVMFAIRPFWRWQTQGNYFFGFNAILNWNDFSAGN